MKIFDINAYFGLWPHWEISVTTPVALIALLDQYHIEQAVVASTRGVFLNSEEGNQHTHSLMQTYPERILGFAIVNPRDEKTAVEQVEQAHRDGFAGLRLFPQHHQYRLDDDPYLADILSLAQDLEMPVLVPIRMILHWGLPQLDVRELDGIAQRFPRLRLIIGGVNYGELRDALAVMRRRPLVGFETSCMQMAFGIETLVQKVGAERIYFGSALPLMYPAPAVFKIEKAEISDHDKELIFGLNALHLLKKQG
jgi:predicted TIM-barrel fold metal-dependent hydrolase